MELAELARRERPLLQALIDEEMRQLEALWGRPVDRREPTVSDHLCRAVLERGGQIRERALWEEPLASRKDLRDADAIGGPTVAVSRKRI